MTEFVIPGQPLASTSTAISLQAGPGTFVRGGKVYSSRVGQLDISASNVRLLLPCQDETALMIEESKLYR